MKKQTRHFLPVLLCTVLLIGCGTSVSSHPTENSKTFDTESTQETEKKDTQESQTQNVTQEPTEQGPEVVKITISTAGDTTLGTNQKEGYTGSFHEYFDKFGASYFLKNVQKVIGEDDFTILNCEGTLTTSNDRVDKTWNHKGDPKYVEILTSSSVEAVSLMNNHIMDYGEEGRDDTIATLEAANVGYAMSGEGVNQYGLYDTGKGVKIGYVSIAWGDGGNLKEGMEVLKEQGASIFIACIHWGTMKTHKIENVQLELGKKAIDLGYDMVVGCHPHVLQGIELYKGKYIVYSMGNFCYGGNSNPPDKDSMIWQQTFTFIDGVKQEEVDAKVIPCRLSSVTEYNDYAPVVLEGKEATDLLDRLSTYCEQVNTYVDHEGRVHARE